MALKDYRLRTQIVADDVEQVRTLVQASGFFSELEQQVAAELVQERLLKGEDSGYEFVMAEYDGSVTGYTCYGKVPLTESSYDLYWIAVHPLHQGRGLGKLLLASTEENIRLAGGARIYIETSSRKQYAPTQSFYINAGYRETVHLEDYYAPADGKLIYLKILQGSVTT